MKQISANKATNKRASFIPDDDTVRYKLNTQYFNNSKTPVKKQQEPKNDEDDIRYKFPPSTKLKSIEKPKPKPTIKVKFWSRKPNITHPNKPKVSKEYTNRRHTISSSVNEIKPKSSVKVRKRVSFLPSPVFSENHIPMVTVPDDLTIHLNEEEANDLGEDLNNKLKDKDLNSKNSNDNLKRKSTSNLATKSTRHKPSFDSVDSRIQGNEYELEFFSKYVVQKLRRMETNQRIYSENLINTVLMLGQLGELNGKSKITET